MSQKKETNNNHNVHRDHYGDNFSAHTQNIFYGTNSEEKNLHSSNDEKDTKDETLFGEKIFLFIYIVIVVFVMIAYLLELAFVFWIPILLIFSFIFSRVNNWYQEKVKAINKTLLIAIKITFLFFSLFANFYYWRHDRIFGNLGVDILFGFIEFLGMLVIFAFIYYLFPVMTKLIDKIKENYNLGLDKVIRKRTPEEMERENTKKE